jgi:hypothetical protein
MKALVGVVLAMALATPAFAISCGSELSVCYDLAQYSYQGDQFCHRFYSGSLRYTAVAGSWSGIPASEVSQMTSNAYDEWFFNTNLTVFTEVAGTDTSRADYFKVVALPGTQFSQFWGPLGGGGGRLAVTDQNYYSDGTIRSARTYFRGDGPSFNWRRDCVASPCDGYSEFDVPGVLTHEMGHWWELLDIGEPGTATANANITSCDTVTMWWAVHGAGVPFRTLAFFDIYGLNHLYGTPTSVGYSFTASPGPAQDTLRWEESNPSGSYTYQIGASDACWGPFTTIGVFNSGDPSITPDGHFYRVVVPAPYNRQYNYRLTVLQTGEVANAVSDRTQGLAANPPSAPQGLTAQATGVSGGGARVALSWTPGSGMVSAYYIYRHWLHLEDCDVQYQAPWAVLGPTAGTSYVDSLPTADDSLYYYVRAVNASGGSGLSNEAFVTLAAPVAVGEQGDSGVGIERIWPNPSRGRANITYRIPSQGHVRLSVYDLAGRLVARSVDRIEGPGLHRAEWGPAGTLPGGAGTYFVRLSVDGKAHGDRRLVMLQP